MNVLLISAKAEHPNGGIAIWTEHYLNACGCESNLSCDLVNVAMTGKRAACATAKRSVKDEIARTRGIMKQLKGCLNKCSYDVAHLNTSVGTYGIIRDYMLARKIEKKGIPVVLHFHCDIPSWVTNRITAHFLKRILIVSKMNLVLCESSRRYLLDRFSAESVKIPNFVDGKLISTPKTVRPRIQNVLFVGRVSAEKGAGEIYKIARCFPDIVFSMVGEVSSEAASWKCPDNVKLLGVKDHSQVLSDLDDADLFLFPSYTEGFSLALAEAMARGLPVIATNVGANEEMLENKGGVIVPVGDVEAMKVALEQMKASETRQKMSDWNRNKVRDQYETSQVIRFLMQCYKNVMRKEIK